MFPFLIEHGKWSVPTFSFMLMIASLAATFFIYYKAPKKGLSQIAVLDMGIIGTLAGVVGSRLFHVFVEAPRHYWEDPIRILKVWNGGFVSYGAIILIGISLVAYLKIRKLPVLRYLDLMALSFPIVVFFVRLGCLGAGCCYGKETNFFIHLIFHSRSSDAGFKHNGIPLHATQIYAMANAVLLFIFLHWLDRKKKFDGEIVWGFLMGYGFVRFFEEFLRGDLDRGVYFGGLISTGQIMSLLGLIVGGGLMFYSRRLAKLS